MAETTVAETTLAVRYFAGASAAARTPGEDVVLPGGADVAALRAELVRRHPPLGPVLEVASLLVDGVADLSGALAMVPFRAAWSTARLVAAVATSPVHAASRFSRLFAAC